MKCGILITTGGPIAIMERRDTDLLAFNFCIECAKDEQ